VSWPWDSGGNSHLGGGPSFGGQGGEIVEVPREVIIRGSTVHGLPGIDPGDDVSIGIAPADVLPRDQFGGSSADRIPMAPRGGVIPTPGTLGLLGVAALILRRRRRR